MSNATMNGSDRALAVAAPQAIAPRTQGQSFDIMGSPEMFEHAQRVAKMYASSELIPPHLRGKLADVTMALVMARELGENPLVVMQNIYVVQGRAGWNATYMIGRANKSGKFKGSIKFTTTGTGQGMSVRAYATLAETGETVERIVSMTMATAENWTKNPKYKSMPEQMLSYRAATLLIRLFAPECMLGNTVDEVEDFKFSTGQAKTNEDFIDAVATPAPVPTKSLAELAGPTDEVEDASSDPAAVPDTTLAGGEGEDVVEPGEQGPPAIDATTLATYEASFRAIGESQGMSEAEINDRFSKARVHNKINDERIRRRVLDAFLNGGLQPNGMIVA